MVVPCMGIQRDLDARMMVMGMMRVMFDIAMHGTQHLGHRRRNHAQQDGKHPEPGTDLLTVAGEHDESVKRRKFPEERSRYLRSSPAAGRARPVCNRQCDD